MQQNNAESLCEVIRQKCADQRWYGPELLQNQPRVKNAQMLQTQFEFAPATQAQLQETEAALGFSLPPTLRQLYQKVANGGFGPEYGLIGAKGGFSVFSLGGTIDQAYQPHFEDDVISNYTAYSQMLSGQPCYVLPMRCWSDRLLPLCDMGCVNTIYIDIFTLHILRGAPTALTSDETNYVLWPLFDSLEKWFKGWLQRAPAS